MALQFNAVYVLGRRARRAPHSGLSMAASAAAIHAGTATGGVRNAAHSAGSSRRASLLNAAIPGGSRPPAATLRHFRTVAAQLFGTPEPLPPRRDGVGSFDEPFPPLAPRRGAALIAGLALAHKKAENESRRVEGRN